MNDGMDCGEKVPIEVSNRHVHLSREDVEVLFGKEYALNIVKTLSQPGQFVAGETVRVINEDKTIENVRVVGPERDSTQVELSRTDAMILGMNVPLRLSGDIEDSPGVTLQGTKGSIVLKKGVIMAKRHIHISHQDSKRLGFVDGQVASIKLLGDDDVLLKDLFVRVGGNNKLAVHIDRDEGTSLKINKRAFGELIR